MLLLCIYVCKYIYLCVSVYTCFIVQNMYHGSLDLSDQASGRWSLNFNLYYFYWPSSNYQLIFLGKEDEQEAECEIIRSRHYLCLASPVYHR